MVRYDSVPKQTCSFWQLSIQCDELMRGMPDNPHFRNRLHGLWKLAGHDPLMKQPLTTQATHGGPRIFPPVQACKTKELSYSYRLYKHGPLFEECTVGA